MSFTELRCKEVICVSDGRRLGFVCDVIIKVPEGCIEAILVPGPSKFFGLWGPGEDYVIPCGRICKVGPDIILVDIDPERCRRPRERKGLPF